MNDILSESEILNLLRNHDCEVTFKKVNGDLRVMTCTLRPTALPVKPLTEEKTSTRAPIPGVISVWCLDRQEWRSFRVSNVISVVGISDKNGQAIF
jgi:hypothetical protein